MILLFLPFHGRSGGIISGLEGLSDESHTHISRPRGHEANRMTKHYNNKTRKRVNSTPPPSVPENEPLSFHDNL